jgi:hypothetical protein
MKRFAHFVMGHARLEPGDLTARRQMRTLAMRIRFHLGLIALPASFFGFPEADAQTWTQVSSMTGRLKHSNN